MILTRLRNSWNHLKKNWFSSLVCTVLMVGWQYSIGIPLLSFQTLIMLLIIPISFALCDFSYTNYKNVRKKLSKTSLKFSMVMVVFMCGLAFIGAAYRDTFHTDALHYLIYYCIINLYIFLLFRTAY